MENGDELVQNAIYERRGTEVVEVYENDEGYKKMLRFIGDGRFKHVLSLINKVAYNENKIHLFGSTFFEHLKHFTDEFEHSEDVASSITDYNKFLDEVVIEFWDAIYKDGEPHADVNLYFIELGDK